MPGLGRSVVRRRRSPRVGVGLGVAGAKTAKIVGKEAGWQSLNFIPIPAGPFVKLGATIARTAVGRGAIMAGTRLGKSGIGRLGARLGKKKAIRVTGKVGKWLFRPYVGDVVPRPRNIKSGGRTALRRK